MFSKLLLKLIDQAIIPALLLVATRIVSIIIVSRQKGIEVFLSPKGFTFYTATDYVSVNTLSTFFMAVAIALGLGYIILKSMVFHDSHIKPHISAKLFTWKMHHLIQASYDLYTQGSVWVSYLYLLTIASGIMLIFDMISAWAFYVCTVISLLYTLLFILDIEAEMDINKKYLKNKDYLEI
jgi:hypothetical protein